MRSIQCVYQLWVVICQLSRYSLLTGSVGRCFISVTFQHTFLNCNHTCVPLGFLLVGTLSQWICVDFYPGVLASLLVIPAHPAIVGQVDGRFMTSCWRSHNVHLVDKMVGLLCETCNKSCLREVGSKETSGKNSYYELNILLWTLAGIAHQLYCNITAVVCSFTFCIQ